MTRLVQHAPLEDLFAHLRRIANRSEDVTLTLATNLEAWPKLPAGAVGYFEQLCRKLEESSSWVNTLTGQGQLKRQAPRGRVSLPPGTPAELGGWSLPGVARKEYFKERSQLAQRYDASKWLPFFRGGSWGSFRVRYEELNLMYRKNLFLGRKVKAKAKEVNYDQFIKAMYGE